MRGTNARPAPGPAGPDGTGKADSLQLARRLLSWGGARWGTSPREPPVLLSDPRVAAVPGRECCEPLAGPGGAVWASRAPVRGSVGRGAGRARGAPPPGVGLRGGR